MANAAILDGVIENAKSAIVKRSVGAVARRMGDLPPTFTTGATALIAGTTLVLGGVAGWKLNDLLRRKR